MLSNGNGGRRGARRAFVPPAVAGRSGRRAGLATAGRGRGSAARALPPGARPWHLRQRRL